MRVIGKKQETSRAKALHIDKLSEPKRQRQNTWQRVKYLLVAIEKKKKSEAMTFTGFQLEQNCQKQSVKQ